MKKSVEFMMAVVFLSTAALSFAAPVTKGSFEGFVQMTMSGKQSGSQAVNYYSKGGMLRIEPEKAGNEGGVVIMDASRKKMLLLMDAQRSYMEMPIKGAASGGPKGAGTAGKGRLVKTGKTEKILGYSCEQYLMKSNEGEMEMWVTKELGPFFGIANPMGGAASAWEKEVKTQGGFPMRVIGKSKDGKEDYRMDVTKVEKKKLSADLFAPPAGYEKMSMPMGMPLGK